MASPGALIASATLSTSAGQAKRAVTPSASDQLTKRPRLDHDDVSMTMETEPANPSSSTGDPRASTQRPKHAKLKKFKRPPPPEPGSSEDVILRDVMALLGSEAVADANKLSLDYTSPLEKGVEIELLVSELSSNGESLSVVPSSVSERPWAVLVPFALPGETIRARVYANARFHSLADLVSVVKSNDELRDMSRVKCQYFGVCAGCQYQMLSYETQLELKKRVVEKAYTHFSGLPSHLIPPIQPTIPSPKTYGYRTKITPHFDVAPSTRSRRKGKGPAAPMQNEKPFELTIGFGEKGRRRVIDIEECVIATPVLNKALGPARENVQKNIDSYKRGATLLLRDSLRRPDSTTVAPSATASGTVDSPPIELTHPASSSTTVVQPAEAIPGVVTEDTSTSEEEHICITDHKATVRETVGSTSFEFPAGSFFQNNNSVLPSLVSYVRDAIFNTTASTSPRPTHLVDTYCGSGLFAISLAPNFTHVAGVEISVDSITSAKHNAQLNNLPPTRPTPSVLTESITFSAGKSETIFSSVSHFPAGRTVVIIDPPRKGCDTLFLEQLVRFKPAKLVYVSCNVHTQARDVGDLLRMMEKAEDGAKTYVVDSLRGLDLFPQTSHVESVAVLTLKDVN